MSEDEFLGDFFDNEDPDSSGERNWWEDEDYQEIDYPDESPGTTMGKAEIDAFGRLAPAVVDPWIVKMTNLPKHFNNFILGPATLDILRKSDLNCETAFLSSFTFNSSEILKSLNPLALSLSHYIRKPNGDVDKQKLSEITKLFSSGQSCNSDNDCKSKAYPMCKSGKCITSIIDIGSVIRYVKIWNKVYKTGGVEVDEDEEEDLDIEDF